MSKIPLMSDDYEVVWSGRDELTTDLDRDYAAMYGDGWDLIWIPTSPLTTPWDEYVCFMYEPLEKLPTRHSRNRIIEAQIRADRNDLAREQIEYEREMAARHLRVRHARGK